MESCYNTSALSGLFRHYAFISVLWNKQYTEWLIFEVKEHSVLAQIFKFSVNLRKVYMPSVGEDI